MEVTDTLNLRKTMVRANGGFRNVGIALMTVVPFVVCVVGPLLDTQTASHGNVTRLSWVVAGIAVFCGILFLITTLGAGNLENHDALRWTEFGNPDAQVAVIEDDWNQTPPDAKHRCENWFLTPHWLLELAATTTLTLPLQYVAWAYPAHVTHYVRGVPVDTTVTVELHRTDGYTTTIDVGTEKAATAFLTALHQRAPWAVYGYSDTTSDDWKHHPSTLIEAAQNRYTTLSAHAPLSHFPYATLTRHLR